MSIWKREMTLEALNQTSKGTMVEHLGIVYTRMDGESLEAVMPVDNRTQQPFGLLHGGASVVLAETLGSMAGFLTTAEGQCVVGTEINASHHRAVASGSVRGVCKPLHLGKSSQVWEIAIFDAREKRCCTSRLTTAILG
ncbi:proofreading thioesterase EntH [Buttiauxella sp. WJP83]|uniref:proofreading thioesterase EntH n=1 Tax=Buttiauxella sp. WJP83 TaxID=2986951 RepID=UPI0022DDC77D|nr:proofreading thioesterase EntH [Buttiauxella sp. WJP83]WBM69727.1 proofreading thioesterase EntH [Buttiauxella sp. WJP83]